MESHLRVTKFKHDVPPKLLECAKLLSVKGLKFLSAEEVDEAAGKFEFLDDNELLAEVHKTLNSSTAVVGHLILLEDYVNFL